MKFGAIVFAAFTIATNVEAGDVAQRSREYFVVGDFDTRRGAKAALDLLTDKTTKVFSGSKMFTRGKDPLTAQQVDIVWEGDTIWSFSYDVAVAVWPHNEEQVRAVEDKYELSRLKGRRVETGHAGGIWLQIDYECEGVGVDVICPMIFRSNPGARNSKVNLTWTNIEAIRQAARARYDEVKSKLP
ncbi:hypothetical protein NOI24_16335 [Neorhizobium galegae]|uniref:hypothetical protein n=1 Tax=Neorhizobium galegae TaxID=399 RepID=UPI0021028BAA|nr:hypothetical protein [Neorhizobium galegae]MCQ1772879.1 hypothetical protein [Neorhizobium galegae]MCQ1799174.1 hypothetical protein [Neorhizobium galegae]